MKAIMVKDEYNDLVAGRLYEVNKVIKGAEYRIVVEGSPRRYRADRFEIWHNGKKISAKEAYRQQQLEIFKKRLGLK